MSVMCVTCRVGTMTLAVPTEAVELLTEFVRGPVPPLAQPWWNGLASVGGRLVACIGLLGRSVGDDAPDRRRIGLLMRDGSAGRAAWALEIDGLGSLSRITRGDGSRPAVPAGAMLVCPESWLAAGIGPGGAALPLLDAAAVSATLDSAT